MVARILTTGLLLDPDVPWRSIRISLKEYITEQKPIVRAHFVDDPLDRPIPVSALASSTSTATTTQTQFPHQRSDSVWRLATEGVQRTPTEKRKLEAPFQLAIEKQRSLAEQGRPYLRHSWHRIDFLSIVSYWVMFGLCLAGVESTPSAHIYIFRALSVLRVSRLLAVTSGTAVCVLRQFHRRTLRPSL